MEFKCITDVIKELVNSLNTYRDAYYNRNESLISDKEYDMLFDELVRLEQEQGLILANSPTQTVGYEVVSQLKKVTHNHPLLSLGKTTEIKEFYDYFNDLPMLLMAKMDGLTCSLLYRDGKLVRAESRGDGETGEDITHNVLTIKEIPLTLTENIDIEVRGEIYMSKNSFESLNELEKVRYVLGVIEDTKRDLDSIIHVHNADMG